MCVCILITSTSSVIGMLYSYSFLGNHIRSGSDVFRLNIDNILMTFLVGANGADVYTVIISLSLSLPLRSLSKVMVRVSYGVWLLILPLISLSLPPMTNYSECGTSLPRCIHVQCMAVNTIMVYVL